MARMTARHFHPRADGVKIHRDIRVRLAELNIGPTFLAEQIGVSRQYVNKVLTGEKTPAADTRRRIEELLDVERGWLSERI